MASFQSQKLSVILFLTKFFLILLTCVSKIICQKLVSIDFPKISIENVPFTTITNISSQGLVLVARDKVHRVKITCVASCPVQWYLRSYNYGSFPDELADNIVFKARREYSNFLDRSSYKFQTEMTLKGTLNKLTGRYDCTCVDKTNFGKNSSIYIYWEGSAGQFLLQAGDKQTINLDASDTSFRILCGVSKPEEKIYLYHNSELIEPNNYTIVQDKEGFTIQTSLLDEKDEFICSNNPLTNPVLERGGNADMVHYIIKYGKKKFTSIHLDHYKSVTEESQGLVRYDYGKNYLFCCSKMSKNHRQVGYYCGSPQQCSFKTFRLSWGHNAAGENETCTWYNEGFDNNDGAVVFRCEREDIDHHSVLQANAEKFYGLNSKSYHSMMEAETEKNNFIRVFLDSDILEEREHYVGSALQFGCHYSSYLFTEGVQWMLEGTHHVLKTNDSNEMYKVEQIWTRGRNHEFLKIRIFNRTLSKVVCLAPVWNSHDWWNASLSFQIQDSSQPQFYKPQEEEVTQDVDGIVSLNCTVSGFPQPQIIWQRDFSKIVNGTEYTITERFRTDPFNNSLAQVDDDNEHARRKFSYVESVLIFKMLKDSSGNYICIAENVVARHQKLFVVKQSDKTVTTIVISTISLIIVLLVILCFSLNKIAQQKRAIRFLTRKEIEEFEKGNPEALARLKSTNNYSTNNAHHLLPYNSDFEVPKERLYVDYGLILGQGTYGMVLKGRLNRKGVEKIVAVKTIKPNEDVLHFKVLLCEVKIMAYIGSHENIVSLIGAYTRNIRNREILVATEFCENGNLQELLRKSRGSFVNFCSSSSSSVSSVDGTQQQEFEIDLNEESTVVDYENIHNFRVTTLDLLKWASEIATGMEYLGVKRVIHGDLACRNILLGSDLRAKVGDFGLSKHLFQYTTYQKKTVQLLPWRWMAIESLQDMEFSLKSDVWSFGVTLYEIFSLGQIPYPGMNWDQEFLRNLVKGYRLEKPMYANSEIYGILISCCMTDPRNRTNFTKLKETFWELWKDFNFDTKRFTRCQYENIMLDEIEL